MEIISQVSEKVNTIPGWAFVILAIVGIIGVLLFLYGLDHFLLLQEHLLLHLHHVSMKMLLFHYVQVHLVIVEVLHYVVLAVFELYQLHQSVLQQLFSHISKS